MRELALIAVALTSCDTGGWRVLDTGSDARLQGVFVISPDRTVAVGDRGRIIDFDGITATETSTDADPGPRQPGFHGVAALHGSVRVAGDQGTVLAEKEGEYLREDSNTDDRLLTMVRATPTILYAAGENGRVIRRRDGAWSRVDVGAGSAKVTGGWANGAGTVAFTTDAGEVIERMGERWVSTAVATGTAALPLFGVWSSTAGADLYAVGLAGSIYRRPAGEDRFELIDVPVPSDLYAIYGASPDRIWAVGGNGTIVEWNGEEWRGVPSGTSSDLYSIHGTVDGSYVVAAGERGTLVILRAR